MKQRFQLPFCIAILLILWPRPGTGQSGAPVHMLDIEDGLSQGFITSMAQGPRGFLWIGTSDGLNKYDGYNFKVYRHDPEDPTSIAHNKINGLTWTQDDRLWVDLYEKGLGMYSSKYDQFLHIPLPTTNFKGPSGPKIHLITRLREDTYLIIHQAGPIILRILETNRAAYLAHFSKDPSPSKIEVFEYELIPLVPSSESISIDWSQNVQVIQSATGLIWINSILPAGLFQLHMDENARTFSVRSVVSDPEWPIRLGNESRKNILLEDTVRHILYFNRGSQLFKIAADSQKPEGPLADVPQSMLYHASMDAQGTMWWVEHQSLYRYDPFLGKVSDHVLTGDIARRKLSASRTFTCIDKSGIIWMGTTGYGLLKYRTRNGAFHHLQIPGNGSISVFRILQNPAGDVVMKAWDFREFILDITNEELTEITGIPLSRPIFSAGQGNNAGSNRASRWRHEMIKEGRFFIDLGFDYEERFYKLSYSRYKAHLILTDYSNRYREVIAEIDSVSSVPFLDSNRVVWIGKINGDLLSINLYTGETKVRKLPLQVVSTKPLRCSSIEKYSEQRFILATNYGLLEYDPIHEKGKRFGIGSQSEESASIYSILTMCRDPLRKEEILWLGFEGAGLGMQNIKTGELTIFTTEDGLPNQIINSILPDDHGHLWISTNKGLSKFNLSTYVFTNFSSVDGLQSNEFNRGAAVRMPSGHLLFGGVNGANFFHPSEIRESNFNPRVEFTQIQTGQKLVPRFYFANSFNRDPHQVYNVPYSSNFITFEFASLDLSAPLKNKYRFRLEGLEKEWSHPTYERVVSYRYLPPGHYTFRVQGTNSDGIWSDHTAVFSLYIRRPWWLQFWFTAIMSILVVLGIYFIIQFRVRHEMRIQDLRNRISADLHDEIGSSLSSISLYAQALLMQNREAQQKTIIEKIKINSQLVQEGLNDIVWSIKPGSDDVEDIYHRMLRIGQELMEIKGIAFSFHVDPDLRRQSMGFTLKRSLYFIYKEALHNILKYAEANKVQVNIQGKGRQIIMTIQDDGVGFDTASPMRGNGIFNMSQRAREMKGTLEIRSEEGIGTELKVIL